jgi:GrpB-like predicted nucleotidyltransferase (UPF0157 family)
VCLEGSIGLRNHLVLRDYLRIHPVAATQYGTLKMRLAEQYPQNIEAYVQGKTAFIVGILEQRKMATDDLMEITNANTVADEDP